MKKILIFILGIILFPIGAFADMGAPEILEYEAEVNNPDGAGCYDFSGDKLTKVITIPYGTKVSTTYESTFNNENYASVNYNKEYCYVNVKNLTILNDEFVVDESKYNMDYDGEILVDSLDIHKGPAYAYSIIGNLKKGDSVHVLMGIGDSGYNWYYIEANGIKGWMCSLDGAIGIKVDSSLYVYQDTKITLTVDSTSETLATIKAGTIINGYMDLDAWSWSYYVEYEDGSQTIRGYIDDEYAASKTNVYVLAEKDLYIYENINDAKNRNKKGVKISNGTLLKADYSYASNSEGVDIINYNDKYYIYYYSEYDNLSNELSELYGTSKELVQDVKLYDYPSSTANEVTSAGKGETVYYMYSYSDYAYISKYQDGKYIYGFIYVGESVDDYLVTPSKTNGTTTTTTVTTNYINRTSTLETTTEPEEIKVETKDTNTNQSYVIFTIACAIIIAAATGCIIFIIKKDDKSAKSNQTSVVNLEQQMNNVNEMQMESQTSVVDKIENTNQQANENIKNNTDESVNNSNNIENK